MASLNSVTLLGNLTRDVELRYTASGAAVASFCLATNERFKGKSGEWEDKAEFHNITLWGKLAEVASEYLAKGKQCLIIGRLQTRKWQDKSGADRYTTEIVGEKMQMLGGKGDGGGSAKPSQQSQGSSYQEPNFDPSDEIPF